MASSRRRPFRFVPELETLEGRVVPAGIITTKLSNHVLTITGDADNQDIALLGGGRGHVSIATQDGETISGKNSFNSVFKVVVKLNDGDDSVTIVNLRLSRTNDTVDLQLGTGDNSVFFDGGKIDIWNFICSSGSVATAATDSLTIAPTHPVKSHFVNYTVNAPNAACNLVLGGMGVDKTTKITTSTTLDDTVLMDDNSFKTFTLTTGGGDDTVKMGHLDQGDGEELLFNGKTTFSLGAGDDFLWAGINVHDPMGAGPDKTPDFTRFLSTVTFDGGDDNDRINVHHPRSTEFVDDDGPTIDDFEEIIYNRHDPFFTNETDVAIEENTTTVFAIGVVDLDGDSLTVSIVGGNDASLFAIVAGDLVFVGAPDFEAPADLNADNVYVVTLLVDDGRGGEIKQTFNVSVLDVDLA
jgi:hypothetical protein